MIWLTDFIAWSLVHVGALYFVTESAFFSPVRGLMKHPLLRSLIYCPGCCGFWLGCLEGAAGLPIFGEPTAYESAINWFRTEPAAQIILTGFAGMGLGAWWGGSRPGIAVMYQIEHGDDDQTTKIEARPRHAGDDIGEPDVPRDPVDGRNHSDEGR